MVDTVYLVHPSSHLCVILTQPNIWKYFCQTLNKNGPIQGGTAPFLDPPIPWLRQQHCKRDVTQEVAKYQVVIIIIKSFLSMLHSYNPMNGGICSLMYNHYKVL